MRRHHVGWQALLQKAAQLFGSQGIALRRAHIPDQLPVARFVLARQYGARLNPWVTRQSGFNFAKFNAITADLHLVVGAAQVLQDPVWTIASKVSALVKPGPRYF